MRIETINLDELYDKSEGWTKLRFFHFWFFHYVNNANQRFYKKLFTNDFNLYSLFNSVLNFLRKAAT